MIEIKNIITLNKLYEDAKSCDEALFAEMRTNVKLRNGDHYNTATKKILNNYRDKGVISNDQRIRITKNHIHRITDEYINSILSRNPDVIAQPFNDSELQDIKDAELSNAVLKWIKDTNDWKSQRRDFVQENVVVGEVYGVVSFDYSKGTPVAQTEEGEVLKNGEVVIDKRFGFDSKRDPAARSFKEARYIFFDKLVDKKEVEKIVEKFNPSKLTALQDAQDGDVVTVFDSGTGRYTQENSKVLLRELFIRPCVSYPKGKFLLATKDFVIMQMDLPLGIFPVEQLGFDRITTSPRCASIIRVLRPYQVEINRASSKMAEHQITLGDDKVIVQNGSKVSNGGKLAGIRVVNVDGQAPTILGGRTGSQYLDYVASEITGMYQASKTQYLLADKANNGDQWQLMHKSMSQRAVFVNHTEAYEQFEKKLFTKALRLAKHYLDESHVIKIIGKKEAVNVAEFKRSSDDGYDITVESGNGDMETMFGQMIMTSQVLQYAGSTMSPEQIGQLIKNLPYANKSETFNTLTLNYDTASNMILSLDRGVKPNIPTYGNIDFYLQALTSRTVRSDFMHLPQQVQMLYQQCIQQLNMVKSSQALQVQQAQQGMIPASGFLTTVNASWKNPTTGKVERLKVPSDAIAWLAGKLNQQGVFMQTMANQAPQVQADIASQVAAQQPSINQIAPQVQGI